MFQPLLEALDQHLSRHGVITDVMLRSERSLLEEEESREVTLFFAASAEEPDTPVAAVHLYWPGEGSTCELEVEIELAGESRSREAWNRMWAEAQAIVPELALSEKRRYLVPEQMAEHTVTFDYHFLLEWPREEAEDAVFQQTLERFAADLGRLLRLFGR